MQRPWVGLGLHIQVGRRAKHNQRGVNDKERKEEQQIVKVHMCKRWCQSLYTGVLLANTYLPYSRCSGLGAVSAEDLGLVWPRHHKQQKLPIKGEGEGRKETL